MASKQGAQSAPGKEVVVKLVGPLECERSTSPELDVFVIGPIAPIAEIPLIISHRHAHSDFHNDSAGGVLAGMLTRRSSPFASCASRQYPLISYPRCYAKGTLCIAFA